MKNSLINKKTPEIDFVIFVLNIGLILYQALIIMLLWNWFVSDWFHIKKLNIIHALGFIFIRHSIFGFELNSVESLDCDFNDIKKYALKLTSLLIVGMFLHSLESIM